MTDQPTRRLGQAAPPDADRATCPECRGAMVWARTYAPGNTTPSLLYPGFGRLFLERGKGSFFRSPKRTEVQARVCLVCGYTKFYAIQPELLREE